MPAQSFNPILAATLAGLVTWLFTSLGAAIVYLRKEFSRKTLDILLGFAGGVMIAASFFSLIMPGLDLAKPGWGSWAFLPPTLGFLFGAVVLRGMDYMIPHLHPLLNFQDGRPSTLPKSFLLIFAITLHNIPEALSVGVAFGAAAIDPHLGISGAVILMLGIGIQNLPEGMAVSLPLVREGYSRHKAFFVGQLSGVVEPLAAILGAIIASFALNILPWAMGFAAGAMIFVTAEEVIPESHASGNGDLATMGLMLGFALMMALDVAFS